MATAQGQPRLGAHVLDIAGSFDLAVVTPTSAVVAPDKCKLVAIALYFAVAIDADTEIEAHINDVASGNVFFLANATAAGSYILRLRDTEDCHLNAGDRLHFEPDGAQVAPTAGSIITAIFESE